MPTRSCVLFATLTQWIGLLAFAVSVTACAHYPNNAPLDAIDPGSGYRISNTPGELDDSRELVFVITFSGGGMRASALAFGVLEELRDTLVEFENEGPPIDGVTHICERHVEAMTCVPGGTGAPPKGEVAVG